MKKHSRNFVMISLLTAGIVLAQAPQPPQPPPAGAPGVNEEPGQDQGPPPPPPPGRGGSGGPQDQNGPPPPPPGRRGPGGGMDQNGPPPPPPGRRAAGGGMAPGGPPPGGPPPGRGGQGRAGRGAGGGYDQAGPPPPRAGRPPLERAMHVASGRWWSDPETAKRLSLTADQQKKMDDAFQQSRLKLIDLNANLQKEEAMLEPLMAAEQPDGPKLLAQSDKVAQARAELEKANTRMLLGIRLVLTPEQWKKVQAENPAGGGGRGGQTPRPAR
jgi:periplasmic protein CpxP/Spy